MISIVLIQGSEGAVFIMADKDNSIMSFESTQKALDFFETPYNDNHKRSYEASMSACIHYIFFQPIIITVKDIEEITNKIAAANPKNYRMHHISGTMYGISTRSSALKYWEKGIRPELISEPKEAEYYI